MERREAETLKNEKQPLRFHIHDPTLYLHTNALAGHLRTQTFPSLVSAQYIEPHLQVCVLLAVRLGQAADHPGHLAQVSLVSHARAPRECEERLSQYHLAGVCVCIYVHARPNRQAKSRAHLRLHVRVHMHAGSSGIGAPARRRAWCCSQATRRAAWRTWPAPASPAMQMQCICDAHAVHMRCACSAHAVRMQCACSAHAVRMQCACSVHAEGTPQGYACPQAWRTCPSPLSPSDAICFRMVCSTWGWPGQGLG